MTSTDTTATDKRAGELDPAVFDLDSWLDGVVRNTAVVPIYARQDLADRIDELVEQLRTANETLLERERAEQSITESGENKLVDVAERDRLRAELKELWEQYEASGVDFELTQMSPDEYDDAIRQVDEKHPEPAFDASDADRARVTAARDALGAELILLGSVTAAGPHGAARKPRKLTQVQLAKMRTTFGLRQYGELIGEARALTLLSRAVDAPFSQRVSDALTERTSDS